MSAPKPLHLRTRDISGQAATVVVNGVPLQVGKWQVEGWRGPDVPVEVTLTFTATIEAEPEPEPQEQPDRACFGCLVHVRRNDAGTCVLGFVEAAEDDLLVIDTFGRDSQFAKRLTRVHDESRQADGSWHWPHDDCPRTAPDTPEPVTEEQVLSGQKSANDYRAYRDLIERDATGKQPQITVNVHVAGSVLSDRHLQDVIASQISRIAAQRGLRF